MTPSCHVDNAGCLICAPVPPQPAVPPRVLVQPQLGWGAGANSVQVRSGRCFVAFTVAQAAGALVGFAVPRTMRYDPVAVEHGWQFTTFGTRYLAHAMERGRLVAGPILVERSVLARLERAGSDIRYLLDGDLVHRSRARVTGPLLVKACLYASGDAVG